MRCVGPVSVPKDLAPGANRVEALTQAWVSEFAAMMADKPQDWHMMQRVYVETPSTPPTRPPRTRLTRPKTQPTPPRRRPTLVRSVPRSYRSS